MPSSQILPKHKENCALLMLGGLFDPIEHGFILFGLKTSGEKGFEPKFSSMGEPKCHCTKKILSL